NLDNLFALGDTGAQDVVLPFNVGKCLLHRSNGSSGYPTWLRGVVVSRQHWAGGLRKQGSNRVGAFAHRRHTPFSSPRISLFALLTDSSPFSYAPRPTEPFSSSYRDCLVSPALAIAVDFHTVAARTSSLKRLRSRATICVSGTSFGS